MLLLLVGKVESPPEEIEELAEVEWLELLAVDRVVVVVGPSSTATCVEEILLLFLIITRVLRKMLPTKMTIVTTINDISLLNYRLLLQYLNPLALPFPTTASSPCLGNWLLKLELRRSA